MNKLLFIALVFASTSAMAQNTSGGQGGQGGGQQFEQRKAAIVQHIGDRIAKMQALQACAQAAADPQSLKACMPNRGQRGGGGQDGGAQGGGEQPESGPGDDTGGQL